MLRGVKGIEAIRFQSADVVRRDLVARIVEAYEKAGDNGANRAAGRTADRASSPK
jgi:phosphate starvation-inducible PhoH-like protein